MGCVFSCEFSPPAQPVGNVMMIIYKFSFLCSLQIFQSSSSCTQSRNHNPDFRDERVMDRGCQRFNPAVPTPGLRQKHLEGDSYLGDCWQPLGTAPGTQTRGVLRAAPCYPAQGSLKGSDWRQTSSRVKMQDWNH